MNAGVDGTSLVLGQKRILEMIATASPLQDTLSALALFIEAQEPGVRCGIHVVADDGLHLRRGGGPSLPDAYHAALDGAPLAPPYLSVCAEVTHRGLPMSVPDVAAETRWSEAWRKLALSSGFAACLSLPVRGSDGRVLASLVMYWYRSCEARPAHPELVEIATNLAGIALERWQAEQTPLESRIQLAAGLAAMQRLQEASTEFIREEDPEALYEKIMDAAVAIMRSEFASLQMLYPQRGTAGQLRLLAFRGFSAEAAKFWEWVRVDSASTCGAALRTGRRVAVPDVEACEFMAGSEDLATYLETGIRAVQTTPLVSRAGQLMGMLSTHWRRPHRPSDHDLRLLDLLARQAADLIERKRSEEALRASERELSDFFDNATVALHWVGPDGTILRANQTELDLLGYARDEYIGRHIAEFHADQPVIEDILARLARGEKLHQWPARLRHKDGSIRDVIINSSALFENGKFIHTRCFTQDVTERKQAEKKQQLLLGELNHRVKNMLATIQAIARQTLRTARSPDQFVANFSGRIDALAKVHTLLTQSTWEGADLRELIRDQALLGPIDEARLTAWGPGVKLEPQLAMHMAMVLHELATNSSKYGAFSRASGRVAVSWTVEGQELRFEWLERGGPPVDVPKRQGFGTSMIKQISAAHQGSAEIAYETLGVRWSVSLPLQLGCDDALALPSRATQDAAAGSAASAQQMVSDGTRAALSGRRILVVEDEPLLALEFAETLKEVGCEAVGPAGTPEEALRLIDAVRLDGALIDANLQGRPVDEVAVALTRQAVPFAFVTGYDRESLPAAFQAVTIISKPCRPEELVEQAAKLVARRQRQGTTIPFRSRSD